MDKVKDILLDKKEQEFLLRIARLIIESRLKGKDPPTITLKEGKIRFLELDIDGKRVSAHQGAFVTLHMHGELRGCIGTFTSQQTLYETIQEMAIASAFEDPRFPPLDQRELASINIEISVLSPLKEIRSPEEIIVGTHGIYITKGFNRGVLLPQVATEYGWDRETFLDHTCLKAGLPAGTWRREKVKIEVFTAQIFGEKEG